MELLRLLFLYIRRGGPLCILEKRRQGKPARLLDGPPSLLASKEPHMSQNISRKELASAPWRESWLLPTSYPSIYLLPSRKKHDSGYHLIHIVGRNSDGSLETAAACDDVCWIVDSPGGDKFAMRTDMTYPGGVAHIWGRGLTFTVGESLSSTDVTVMRNHT